MQDTPHTSTLRLVGDARPAPATSALRRGIASENQSAAELSPTDARWVFAVRVSRALEGGRAAILRPERRRRLLTEANAVGLRPFDANLVIAIVQDGAREDNLPLGRRVAERVSLVRGAETSGRPASYALIASLALGAALLALLIAWVR